MNTYGSTDWADLAFGAVIGAIAVIFVVLIIFTSKPDYKQEAIERGFAEYNSITGDWQWKEGE